MYKGFREPWMTVSAELLSYPVDHNATTRQALKPLRIDQPEADRRYFRKGKRDEPVPVDLGDIGRHKRNTAPLGADFPQDRAGIGRDGIAQCFF